MAGAISAAERKLLAQVERELMGRGRLQLIERLHAGDAAAPEAILECLQGTQMSAIVEGGNVERLVQVARAESVRLQVENLTVLQTGEGALLQRATAAPTISARSRPVALLPRRFDDLLGREQALGEIASSLSAGRPVERFGEDGVGKTSLARGLAHSGAHPDGVIFCGFETATAEDLSRHLFEALYEATPGFLPSEGRLRTLLAGVRALVVIDDLALGRDDLGRLLDLAPGCGFALFSAERRLIGEGDSEQLAGLGEAAAGQLIERWLGRPLRGEEQGGAAAFAAGVRGNPLKLIEAASAVAEGRAGWEELAGASPKGVVRRLLSGLSAEDRRVLEIVHAAGGGPLDVATIEAVSGEPDAAGRADRLAARGLLVANTPTYRLPLHLGDELTVDAPLRGAVRAELEERLRSGAGPPAAGLLAALEAGGPDLPPGLLLAADGELLRRGQLGAWRRALDQGLASAGARGDRALRARMLHQLGSRALLLDHGEDARSLLTLALELREALGDDAAAALTRHNLGLISGGPPDGGERPAPDGRPRWPWIAGLGLVAVVGTVIGLLVARGGPDDGEPRATRTEFLSASPARHDFDEVDGPRTVVVTLARLSGAPEFGLGIRFVEGGPPAFRWRGCAVRLGPQRPSCDLLVTFTPAPGEAARARLAVRPQAEGAAAVRVDLSGSGAAIAEDLLQLALTVDPMLVAPGQEAQAIISASAPVEVALSADPEGRVRPGSTSIAVQAGEPTAVVLLAGEVEGLVDIVAEAEGAEARATLTVDAPPELRLPEVVEEQTPLEATSVDFAEEVSATDALDGDLEPTCAPPSGSTFAAGSQTTVTCEVTDSAGNRESGTFTVVVQYTPVE